MTQEKTLHELYQLLWEQIKDVEDVGYIFDYVDGLNATKKERDILENHMFDNMGNDLFESSSRKAFVLRMIEETKNN